MVTTPGFSWRTKKMMDQYHTNHTVVIYPVEQPSYMEQTVSSLPDKSEQVKAVLAQHRVWDESLRCFAINGLVHAFNHLGWDGPLFKAEPSHIREQLNIIPKYTPWFNEVIRFLKQEGIIQTATGENRFELIRRPGLSDFDLKQEQAELASQHPAMTAHVELLTACLENLSAILTGVMPPTDVLFANASMKRLEGVYKDNPVMDFFNERVADVVEQFVCLKQKDLPRGQLIRILEVGAGTGATSAAIFNRLQPFKDRVDYAYTDISKSFLMYGEQKYRHSAPYLRTAILDIERPFEEQGIRINHYDMVVAANVLHATRNIGNTLARVKSALKGNGLLVLNELSTHTLFATLTFGLTDGWWLFEDSDIRLPGSPGLSSEQWKRVLAEERFYPVKFPDPEARDLGQQIIVAESHGWIRQVQKETLVKAPSPETEHTVTQHPTQINNKRTAAYPDENPNFNKDRVSALIRQQVSDALEMNSNAVDDNTPLSEIGVDSIIAVELVQRLNAGLEISLNTTAIFDYPTINRLTEHINDNYTLTIRKTHHEHDQKHFRKKAKIEKKAEIEVGKTGKNQTDIHPGGQIPPTTGHGRNMPQKVLLKGPGTINDLALVDTIAESPGPFQVQVAIKSFSLNFADLLCVKGLYSSMPTYPFTPGFEASGTVIEAGEEVLPDFQPGNGVIILADRNLGLHADVVTVHQSKLMPKPPKLSFEEACALPVVSLTVIEALLRKAQLKKEETVLIQTAAGGIGLIAVRLAQHMGARIIGTAGRKNKLTYLASLGLPELIHYKEQDFEEQVKAITHGKGVDVVINTLPGDAIEKGMRCLAPSGRYIEIAMTALKSARNIDLTSMVDNQSFHSIDLRKLAFNHPEYFATLKDEFAQLVEQGIIKATIDRVFDFDQIQEAYRYLEAGENIGKIVINAGGFSSGSKTKNSRISPPRVKHAAPQTDIAIIGISCRFGGADSKEAFWEVLKEGRSLITEIPEARIRLCPSLHPARFFDARPAKGKSYCKWGSFLNDIDQFDPVFFGISGIEAENSDPQQRLFLQECWKAIEDGGYNPRALSDVKCGVYVGAGGGDYLRRMEQGGRRRLVILGKCHFNIGQPYCLCFKPQGAGGGR